MEISREIRYGRRRPSIQITIPIRKQFQSIQDLWTHPELKFVQSTLEESHTHFSRFAGQRLPISPHSYNVLMFRSFEGLVVDLVLFYLLKDSAMIPWRSVPPLYNASEIILVSDPSNFL